jgi:hypothetical protein
MRFPSHKEGCRCRIQQTAASSEGGVDMAEVGVVVGGGAPMMKSRCVGDWVGESEVVFARLRWAGALPSLTCCRTGTRFLFFTNRD